MIAGATYTLPLDIDYPIDRVSKIIVTLNKKDTHIKIKKEYPNPIETYVMPDGRLGVRLSQQDTVDLVGSVKVEAQINLPSGSVAKTVTEKIFIDPTLDTEFVDGASDNGEVLLSGVSLKIGAPITETTGGGSVEIDDTLTKEGAAADAKAVGDKLQEQQKEIDKKQPSGDYAEKKDIPSSMPASDVYDWAKQPKKPSYTADEVGADPTGTASSKVSEHNASDVAHNDIRLLISGLTERLNALANSTDDDLDQLAEIVAYIKANKSLIDSITTSKVNVADIIDNLTTSVSNKPLSAKMGVQLKSLIDAIKIPTELPASDVYDWAKQPKKPSYTADEVGARPSDWMPSAAEVGAEPTGTASGKVSEHNASDVAHNDIRLLISGLTERLNALANSTDDDLDQLAEIVAYIKSNKSLIDSVTTSKVSVADIIDNLTTSVSNKPLSAKMGVQLKSLIDAIKIPTELPASDVYEWAKQPQKPSYTADEVGLSNVENVKQYSANNPPPYPVTSVNGKTGSVTLSAGDVGAATAESVNELSEAIADYQTLTLGMHTDGLLYIFKNAVPVGIGIELPEGGLNGYVDSDKNIVLKGEYPEGTFVMLELEDGTAVKIGEVVYEKEPELADFTNLFDPSTAKLNKRIKSDGSFVDAIGYVSTPVFDARHLVPLTNDTSIYVRGASFNSTDGNSYAKFATYKANGIYSYINGGSLQGEDVGNGVNRYQSNLMANNCPETVTAFGFTFWVGAKELTADDIKDIILTIDEPIYK